MLSDRCPVLSVCPVCDVGKLWPNGWMDQDATWQAGRPRPWPHCVRWERSSPSPQFSAHISCGQTAGWIKMALGIEVGLAPGYIVLDWDPTPYSKKGAEPPPQFLAHFYCGQTDGCIKMPLGMEIGLCPGDFVLDGEPVPPEFSGHVYYSCDFVRTLHGHYWFVQVQVLYAFCFY